jgi:hypothetical protein
MDVEMEKSTMGLLIKWHWRRVTWLTLVASIIVCTTVYLLRLSKDAPRATPFTDPDETIPDEQTAPPTLLDVETHRYSCPPMAFSSDSVWLYYASGDRLVSRNLHDGSSRGFPLTDIDPSLALTADLKLFRVSESTPDNPLLARHQLFAAKVSGGTIGEWEQLDHGPNSPIWVAASPAGHTIALVRHYEESVPGEGTFDGQALEIAPSGISRERRVLVKSRKSQFYPPKFSADGRFLVWTDAGDYTLKVWRAEDGQLIRTTRNGAVGFALSVDGSLVAEGGGKQRCRVVSVADGAEIANWRVPAGITSIEFHPNGSLIVACNHRTGRHGEIQRGTLWLRDAATGQTKYIRVDGDGPVDVVMVSPDGKFLAISSGPSRNKWIRLWRWEQLAP